ncbi:Hypothetical protein PENO1_001360 [Penicillium occitanis (nom. inval.)]|nr:hypothetical protein PENOC_023690 [Penicillium occitanis (nom. inval.)]PCH09350.1 Hypothetical protein PENO1_001360 [Penicillium occitanis (nom. inval.)]
MSLFDQRRRPSPSPSVSPSPSPLLQRIRGVSPTQRTSSQRRTSTQRLSSRTTDTAHHLRYSSSRKISRNNPPHVNKDIAKSQFTIMSSRPETPNYEDFPGDDASSTSTTLVNANSMLLQEMLQEGRASRNSRNTPRLSGNIDRPTTSGSHSKSHVNSPSEKHRRVDNFAPSGHKDPRDMGIRATNNHVSNLTNENFNLKLDLHYCNEKIASMQKKMARIDEMEKELERMHDLEDKLNELQGVEEHNQQLQKTNERLQSGVEIRDQALTEAVKLITGLEAKVDDLRTELRASRGIASLPKNGFTSMADDVPEVCTPKAQTFVDIPDRTSSRKGTVRRPRKSPSFLHDKSESTAALRSLYLAEENKSVWSVSASTIGTTVDSKADPQSPRLSILSECSYFSPHDTQRTVTGFDQLDRLDHLTLVNNDTSPVITAPTENLPIGHFSDRISEWMQFDERSPRRTSSGNRHRVRAISDVSGDSHVPPTHLDEPFQPMRKTRRTQKPSPRQEHLAEFGGNLPPTPDTMSTFRPAFKNESNASLHMDKSISRPRSAGELTTRSASMSTHSDGINTAASVVSQHNVQNNSTSLHSTFHHYGRGSAKATRVLGPGSPSNPRLSCYGGDLLFNGEGVENVVSDMQVARASSPKATTPTKASDEFFPVLTPQDWLDAAKPEEETSKMECSSPELEAEELLLADFGKDDIPDDVSIGDANASRNPPLRLRAWANESQPVPEVQQHRRRLSRFFTRNRTQKESQPESVATPNTAPSPVPHKNLLVKHRRTSSGPGLNSDEGTSAVGHASGRRLSKSLLDRRLSTASRPITSDGAEPRSKGSLLLGWMKGSHNKDNEPSTTGHLRLARSTTERPKSTASLDVSALNLGHDIMASDDEPVRRARRRSRRMA